MPGDNCSIYGCSVSRHKKFRGTSLFKVPSGSNEFDTTWREKLLAIVKSYRVVDESFKRQLSSGKIFIWERHFDESQYFRHESGRTTLNPGAIPTLNLPQKSHPSSATSSTRRSSADTILTKRTIHAASLNEIPSPDDNDNCYKSFEHKLRVSTLKLHPWRFQEHENHMLFSCSDDIHYVPKYELYVNEDLEFTLRCFYGVFLLIMNFIINTTSP